jgi:YggT family protein
VTLSPLAILLRVIDFYEILIIVYVLMSWLRPGAGLLGEIYRALGTITEPWLGLFRRIIPPIGMIDITPIIAIVVLNLIGTGLGRLLG